MAKTITTSAQFRKLSDKMKLAQQVMRAREGVTITLTALDAVLRSIVEDGNVLVAETATLEESGPPSTGKPSERPTRFVRKWDFTGFDLHVQELYQNATSEQDRANVRKLVQGAVAGELITDEEAQVILATMK